MKEKIRPVRGEGIFRDYSLGYVHIDVKHLPKLQTADGEVRKRFLYVAIDRCSRFWPSTPPSHSKQPIS
nr:hypothetical protein [Gluconobacter thailandicus]